MFGEEEVDDDDDEEVEELSPPSRKGLKPASDKDAIASFVCIIRSCSSCVIASFGNPENPRIVE